MSENTLCILLYYHTYSMALLISPGVDRSIFVLHIGDKESTLQKKTTTPTICTSFTSCVM